MRNLIKVWLRVAFSERFLLYTNTVTGTALLTIGDLLHQHAQLVVDDKKWTVDWQRSLRVAAVGCFLSPMNHFYYRWLDATIIHGSRSAIVVKKLCVDTLTAPIWAASYVFGYNLLDGKTVKESAEEYKQKCLHFLMLDLMLWPPVQAINFWFLAPRYRVLFVSSAALVDSSVMAHIKQNDFGEDTKTTSKAEPEAS